ncbi:MAG: DUF1826 domain-containing protein [Rhodobacteraceae bacterium]|nr:DUF1826 domain-containing protein [Paracoccaceae bacterium]
MSFPSQATARGVGRSPDISCPAASTAQDVLVGKEAEILEHIARPAIAATIWKRKPTVDFQKWVDGLGRGHLPALRVILPVEQAESAVQAACDVKHLEPGPERDMLASDIGALAYIFGTIMDARSLQIRLDVCLGAMCPKFHLDNVTARLLCTYRGPGTQYVLEAEQNRSSCHSQLATGDVAIFKGHKWPSEEACSLLHRSPSMQHGTGPRLLLVIDAVDCPVQGASTNTF